LEFKKTVKNIKATGFLVNCPSTVKNFEFINYMYFGITVFMTIQE